MSSGKGFVSEDGGGEDSAYDGIRVLDLCQSIAGSYATMYLSDHGADVIKVEPEGGDELRAHQGFQSLNRGKRSIVVKRKAIAGLCQHVDIIVVDVTQEEAAKNGIAFADLRDNNPMLIYLSVTPYGEKGPLVGRPYSPALMQAANGMMSHQISYSGTPTYLVLPLSAYATGPLAAAAVGAALFARERWAIGQHIEVSELAGSMAMLVGADRHFTNPHPMGSKGPIPSYRLYQAGDGKWFFLACANEQFFHKMLNCIGHPHLINDPRLDDAWVFVNQKEEIRDVLVPILESTFRSNSRDYWVTKLQEADCPAQPVLTRDEFFASAFVQSNKMRVKVEHKELGDVEMMGVPLMMGKTPGEVRGPAPMLGEHTMEVLQELSAVVQPTFAPLEELMEGSMLAGTKILDLSAYIAGPLGARHLASLGATVIKVEPPSGDPFRNHTGFSDFNQGKQAICLNLQMTKGQEVFYQLVKDADVVIENFRPGVTTRLGVDYDTLKQINPSIIYVSSPGYGIYERMKKAPAFDPLLQSLSGAALQQGGGTEPALHTIPLNDVITPLIFTFGVCSALYHRRRTGHGQRIQVSLAQSSLAIQAAEFTRFSSSLQETTSESFLKGGIDFHGPSAACAWYHTKGDGIIFVEATTDAQKEALLTATAANCTTDDLLAPLSSPSHSSSAQPHEESHSSIGQQALSSSFMQKRVDEWVTILDRHKVPCSAVTPVGGCWNLEAMRANELVIETEEGRAQVGTLIKSSLMTGSIDPNAPRLSEHAVSILTQYGYTAKQLNELSDIGALILPQEE